MKNLFKSLFTAVLLGCLSIAAMAQSGPYGNEWIDYSHTYYKFKVGASGVYRIPRSALNAAGLPAAVLGSNFMLYRDGIEVPVYVSAESMSGTDYIEFMGRGADGVLDKELYGDPAWQPDPRICLFTDTAAYFLTYDNAGGHLRYAEVSNNIPVTPPAPEAYNWNTVGNYYKNVQTEGPSYDNFTGGGTNPGAPFFSPSFENGEGYVNALVSGYNSSITLATPNMAPVSVNATLRTSVTSRSYRFNHEMNISVNGNLVGNGAWGVSETKNFLPSFPANQLSAVNSITYAPVNWNPLSTAYDVYGVSYAEIKYPRNYDMTGLAYYNFRLNASAGNAYIEFTNFNNPARLYDITNRKWYAGVAGPSGQTRFYLQPSLTERELVLMAANTGAANINPVKTFQFTNYSATTNQGDYIIVTHSQLAQLASGHNYIDEYRAYRASITGGQHNVVVADVTELYDQFAYGYDTHPLSIKHFLKHAYDTWTIKPVSVNIIGRGLQYEQYAEYKSKPSVYTFPIVPVYGSPGSDVDFVNFGTPRNQKIQIGRVSVWNGQELGQYFDKLKLYELALKSQLSPTAESEGWKKQVMHLVGANSKDEESQLISTLNTAATIIQDTLLGARVHTFSKNSTTPVDPVTRQEVDSLINNGLNMITYFGHASPTLFNYSLPEPETYRSSPRFPIFLALGCDVAQIFGAFTTKPISEKYTLAPTGGAIALLATDNYGYTGFLDEYLYAFYKSVGYQNFGKSIGLHALVSNNKLFSDYCSTLGLSSSFSFAQIECQILTGDPAIAVFGPSKPDYHVAAEHLSAIPGNVSTALDSFQLRISTFNLAKALNDTVDVKVEHITPGGVTSFSATYRVPRLYNTDTTYVSIPVSKTNDIGINKYKVTIDPNNKFDEVSETNNTAILDLFIFSDNLVPVYPHEFAIVNKQGLTLKASTLNPFRISGRYLVEIDTTEDFNSAQKLQTSITSVGGIIKWTPNIILRDSVVYYWRTAFDSIVAGDRIWASSSFIYLAQGSPGWNQSHYFQYQKDGYANLQLTTGRQFKYALSDNTLRVLNKIIYVDADGDNVRVYWNGDNIQRGPQTYSGLQVMVIDSITGKFWKNSLTDASGARPPSDPTKGTYLREFDTQSPAVRLQAARFLDSIPNGNYVMVKNIFWDFPPSVSPSIFINEWKADTALVALGGGPGKSLYHSIYNLGFPMVDSFNKESVFLFMCKKGEPAAWPVVQQFSSERGAQLELNTIIKSVGTKGNLISKIVGPAKAWTNLKWRMHALDSHPETDSAYIVLYGLTNTNTEALLYRGISPDTSLSFIDANTYPRLRMEWITKDSISTTAPQLNYWRVLYSPLPEAALNPAGYYTFSDSLQTGQQQNFSVAVENLTEIPMDSILVSYKVIDANGVTHAEPDQVYRPLPGLDTLHADYTFDPAKYPGKNLLFVEMNPAGKPRTQPEQYHPNNLGYLPFSIGVDKNNPLLDVTFDGVHILNQDIISSKPFIKIALKDDNKYLALNDTALLKVSIRYLKDPGTTPTVVPFDGTVCKFIPGQTGANGKNEAIVEYRPNLQQDGSYELLVEGSDRSQNGAGTPQGNETRAKYKIEFEVDNHPSVSNVLNYPNPFSTATAFIFTITGSQIPSQFKIQILTVSGRVVREITKQELGPLHIGRNITEYKWDGRDQFGQLLGNGVYMYRVATSLNGNDIDHRDSGADSFFKNGYGKMYIMR